MGGAGAPAAAAPAFSFGGAAASTPGKALDASKGDESKSDVTPLTPAATKPDSATGASTGLSINLPSSSSSSSTPANASLSISTPSTSLTTPQITTEKTHAPPDYSQKTLRQILEEWNVEFCKNIDNFEEQAKRVTRWDKQLQENQKCIEELVDHVHMLMVQQEDLDSVCKSIEAHQNE